MASNPNFPNNNGTPSGSTYNVTISSGQPILNVNATISTLSRYGGTPCARP